MSSVLTHPVTLSVKKSLAALGVPPAARILVGVSGGVDSMVLLYVLRQLQYQVSASHVNFNLRGEESHNDALFVRQWCEGQDISSYLLSQDTKDYAAIHGVNTQTAAREIRYEWWEDLVHKHKFDFVATAHHLDDRMETVFLNLLRGTGLKGMKGIPAKREFYIRPLLDVSRKEIEQFALEFDIPFRTDSSNLTDDYQRNRLRHLLFPLLEQLTPGFHSSMKHTLHRINLEWEVWERAYLQWQEDKLKPQSDGFLIRSEAMDYPFLLRWLEDRGIPWNLAYDFLTSAKADSGHVLSYEKYKLSRTEDGFYFEERQPFVNYLIPHTGHFEFGNFSFTIEKHASEEFRIDDNPLEEFINTEVIEWPLHIRNVQPGDHFQPIGMNGKTKKIQDLMVDLKLERFEKDKLMLLTNNEHILWVIGLRLDERAKVSSNGKEIYRLKYSPTATS